MTLESSKVQKFVAIFAILLVAGCMSVGRIPLVDLAEPGWTVQQGEALWKPKRSMPELAGEVVFATNRDGRCFVQFAKTTIPAATAWSSTNRWAIELPAGHMAFRGKGAPPSRFGWLQLGLALRNAPLPPGWVFEVKQESRWRLENSKTGEVIEGVLSP